MAKNPVIPLSLPFEQVTLDLQAQDAFVRGNGPIFQHYKAIPCPIGQVDRESIRAPHHEHANCSNGFIYKLAGEFQGSFTANSATLQLTDLGFLDGSTVSLTLPLKYIDSDKQVYVSVYDKLYIKDNVVITSTQEKVEAHISGVDRLSFPAIDVEYLIDNAGKEYSKQDFSVQNGNIVWTGSNRPQFDAISGKGAIYSIRYFHLAYYYVSRLMHEVRIVAQQDLDGNITYKRGPHQILITREKFFLKKQEEEKASNAAIPTPSQGLFGAR